MTHKKIKLSLIILSITLILLLAACGGNEENQAEDDPNLAITQVFETAMAALTETALVQPATETPAPTETLVPTFTTAPTLAATATTDGSAAQPTSTSSSFIQPTSQTSSCDVGGFVRDVTVPDGTTMNAGEDFTKTWEIKNNGTCTWNEDYTVIYYSGEQMADDTIYAFTTEDIEPGESVNISVDMTAPSSNGEYISYWVLRNDLGQTFFVDGGAVYVQITVGTAAATSTGATATATTAPTGDVPIITFNSPSDGDDYTTDETITFSAVASDTEDGDISASLIWYDNNTQFHTGSSFTDQLTEGSHTIKVRITDSDNNTVAASITITVSTP